MLDFNKAHSNSAEAARRKKKKEMKQNITDHMLASCEGKVSFDTFKLASGVAKERRKSVNTMRRPYHCYYCRRYHIGT